MSQWWAISMLLSGGLFAGGVVAIALERVPAWQASTLPEFRETFAHTLRRVDRLQPALLTVCLVSTIGFALSADEARTPAWLAAAGFLVVLVGSVAWLVPMQRRLVAAASEPQPAELERLRTHWLRGHLVRTVVALAALTLAVVAAVS